MEEQIKNSFNKHNFIKLGDEYNKKIDIATKKALLKNQNSIHPFTNYVYNINNDKLDCKTISDKIINELKQYCLENNIKKRIAIIYEGNNNGQKSYIKNITKQSKFNFPNIQFDLWNISNKKINDGMIESMNNLYDGIIPIKPFNNLNNILLKKYLQPLKDLDDFTGRSKFTTCTAEGVLTLLKEYNISTINNHITIIGRGEGDKISNLLSNKINNATVTKLHSKTPKEIFNKILSFTDVIITATGQTNLLNKHNIKDFNKKIIIDIGRVDVSKELYNYKNVLITPKINGTGLLTTTILFKHIIKNN